MSYFGNICLLLLPLNQIKDYYIGDKTQRSKHDYSLISMILWSVNKQMFTQKLLVKFANNFKVTHWIKHELFKYK